MGSWAKAFDCVLPSPGLLENDTRDHQVLARCKAVCVLRRAVTSVGGCVVESDKRVASYHCYPCCLGEISTEQRTNAPKSHGERVENYRAVSPTPLATVPATSVVKVSV